MKLMKLVIAVILVFFVGILCYGAPISAEAPIIGFGTPVTIAVSSTTLTKVPSSQTSGRMGIFVSLPQLNSGMVGFYGDCTSTSLASTIRPIEISTATGMSPSRYFSMREDVCLWLLSLNTATSSQNLNYQEVKQ